MASTPEKRKLVLRLWVAGLLLYLVPLAVAELLLGWHYRAYVHWVAFFALVAVPSFPFFSSIAKERAARKGKEAWGCACWLAFGLALFLAAVLVYVIPWESSFNDGKTVRLLMNTETGFLQESVCRYAEKRGPFFMEEIPRPPDDVLCTP